MTAPMIALKMRLTSDAIAALADHAAVEGYGSPALVTRAMILEALDLGTPVAPMAVRPSGPAAAEDKPDPMGQLVMRMPVGAVDALSAIAAERGLESPALAARALLIEAMASDGIGTPAVNPVTRTRRETETLSEAQGDAIRLIVRLVILIEQVEQLARDGRDAALLARATASRSILRTASDRLASRQPNTAVASTLKATGYAINTITRSLHAGDPIARHLPRLITLMDSLDLDAERL